ECVCKPLSHGVRRNRRLGTRPSLLPLSQPEGEPQERNRGPQSAGRRGTPGYGASRPWMACGRALEPWTAESRDASYPRAAAAPSEASALDAVAFAGFLASSLHSLPSQSPAPRTSPRYAVPPPAVPVMPEQNSILTPAQLNTLARDLLESAFPLVW